MTVHMYWLLYFVIFSPCIFENLCSIWDRCQQMCWHS